MSSAVHPITDSTRTSRHDAILLASATATTLKRTPQDCMGSDYENAPEVLVMQRSKLQSYSITSSARASSVCGTLRPSAFAVLRLTISSTLVDRWTGRSAGLSPLRILAA